MNKFKKFLNFILPVAVLFLPLASVFADQLVPCDGPDCDFNKLMQLVNNVINFAIFKFALPFSGILFAYAGFLFIISGGDTGKRTKAKNIFFDVAVGLIIALGAWLIVHTIFIILGYQAPTWTGL